MDPSNIFDSFAHEAEPTEPQWVRTRSWTPDAPKAWEFVPRPMHVWAPTEDHHEMSAKCQCDPVYDLDRSIDGTIIDVAVLHRNSQGKVVDH